MNKKVVSIVAIIALVAILGVCLVACNEDSNEKKLEGIEDYVNKLEGKENYVNKLEGKGYDVETMPDEDLDAYRENFGVDVKWVIYGENSTDHVGIYACANADDAKAFANILNMAAGYAYAEVKGKIVFFGTEQGIIDARYPVL